jgi:phage-related protein
MWVTHYSRLKKVDGQRLLKLCGGGVVEIVEDYDGDTFRCVYTTKVNDVIVVLHAFQKKSKRGSETPKHEIDLIHARLRAALAKEWN